MGEESEAVPTEEILFGELLVARGACSREKVAECLEDLGRLYVEGVEPRPRLGDLLVEKGHVAREDLHAFERSAPPGSKPPSSRPSRTGAIPPSVEAAAAVPGNVVGKYVRTRRLGAGGMGEVWEAWDRDLRRWVALKFLKGQDADELSRFRREAQTAAQLNHPNIASIHEVGESNGKPFIVMQLVRGQTLASFPRDDVRCSVSLVRDAAVALQHAHEHGVIHRDLKPGNLMVEEAKGKRRLFVMDFGLAKQTSTDSSLSVSGLVVGTPAYMAPEQARGDSKRVTPASDIYSLGATLYDLLTGQPPFKAGEVYALLEKVVSTEPVPVRKKNPRIDRELETITMKCLEKEAGRRYLSARELAEDLSRWLSGEPIHAHPPTLAYKVRKFVARRRLIVGLSAALLLVIALVPILISNWLGARADSETLKELGTLRTRMVVLREWTRQPFQAPEKIRKALEAEIGKQTKFIGRHPELPQGFYVRAQGRRHLYDLDGAEADLREALRLAKDFSPAWMELGQIRLERYLPLTYAGETLQAWESANRERSAEPMLEEAVVAFRKGASAKESQAVVEDWGLLRTRDDEVSEIHAEALRRYYLAGERDKALAALVAADVRLPSEEFCRQISRWSESPEEKLKWIERAIKIAPHYAPAYVDRAVLRFERYENAGALEDCTQALRINPLHVVAHCYKGRAHNRLGDVEAAIKEENEAIGLDSQSSMAYYYRGFFKKRKGDYAGAIADFSRAIELFPDFIYAFVNRSEARRLSGDWKGALSDLETLPSRLPKWGYPYHLRGLVLEALGDRAGALREQTRAIELDPRLWDAYLARARYYYEAGDYLGCHSDAERMVELGPDRAEGYTFLGTAKAARGDAEGGLGNWKKALELAPRYATAYIHRGYYFLGQREFENAEADFSRAIEIDPALSYAYYYRAAAERSRADVDAAVRDLEKVLRIDPPQSMTRRLAEQELESLRKSKKP